MPTVTPLTFAFLGAYFFAIQMLFRRYVRSDLRGSAYVAIVVRVALAVIGIWAIGGIVEAMSQDPLLDITPAQLCLLGFVIGVFPVVVWRVIRSLRPRSSDSQFPDLESKFTLDGLDGLTVWHQSRLEEEDIENIPNMATADIVDLLVNTRLPAGRIVDWVDQAILLTHLRESSTESGPVAAELARHGVRTASSLLSVAAVHGGQFGRAVDPCWPDVPSLIAAVRTSPNLALVLRWRGMSDADADRPATSAPPAPTRHVGAGVALLSPLSLAIGGRRSRRRTILTDPHG